MGGGGQLLSGGQRIRVLIARAILRRPSLLLLDEATAAVDEYSERKIVDALRRLRGQMTIVVCSHSVAVMQAADTLLRLDGGVLVDVAGSI